VRLGVVRSAFVPHCAFPSLGRYDPSLTDPLVPRSVSVIAGRHRAAGLIHAATIYGSPCLRQPITLTSLRSPRTRLANALSCDAGLTEVSRAVGFHLTQT